MKDIRIKLSSNYQQIEFTIDDINEDISDAVALINELGRAIGNSDVDSKKTAKTANNDVKEDMATAAQIKLLKRLKFKNPEKLTKKQASAKITELTKK